VIALLLWVYYSAQIFFLGAEFTRQYALWFGSLRHERLRVEGRGSPNLTAITEVRADGSHRHS
jgi:uncharacterized BrkB/YihY/UPF0761 family membrane protein